ncbi:division abnormally delayed protein isoform X3 [Rhodnius prolixus]
MALHTFLQNNFVSVRAMLASTAGALHANVRRLAVKSEKNTMNVFQEVYRGMFELVKSPLSQLYKTLREYLEKAEMIPTDLPPAVPSSDGAMLESSVNKFYKELFPMVYHQVVHNLKTQDFTPAYRTCLVEHTETIMPFGSIAHKMANNVAQSFETTKVLIQALTLGLEVLNTTDEIMSKTEESSDSCREALLRLYYCPKCLGLAPSVKPCNNYCLNVMRGCLTQQRTTELDLPWSNFLMETQKLVKEVRDGQLPNIGNVLAGFSNVISDAIMYATLNSPSITTKVQEVCGAPKLLENSTMKTNIVQNTVDTSLKMVHEKNQSTTNLWTPLNSFLEAIEKTKARGFYANLAELLCSDESFAETRDTADCWNGHRIGEYTKALVRPGMDAQKYNPEMSWTAAQPDARIGHLSDKLRHMRQVVVSRLSEKWGLESESLIKSEGSGSGAGPSRSSWPTDDEEYEQPYWTEGSGSGDHAVNPGVVIEDNDNTLKVAIGDPKTNKNIPSKNDPSAANNVSYSPLLLMATIFVCFSWIQ